MAEFDEFLEAVRLACEQQNLPATTAHLEFAPGQFEINLHHVDDVLTACDHAVLLKRLIKGVAAAQNMGATFMAKPFADQPGSGLHVHISVYDADGNNIFADPGSGATPPIGERLRHAIGGLGELMGDCQAVFAPNANSYRRLQPGCYAPLSPNWGYNHRGVSLRIPVSDADNLRIEHRVAGADANPYLVMACVLAGIHYGLEHACDPGTPVAENEFLEDEEISLTTHLPQALDAWKASTRLHRYLGEDYCSLFEIIRRDEYDKFSAVISNVDYEWYLRSV
jgi:glutamine synthetase